MGRKYVYKQLPATENCKEYGVCMNRDLLLGSFKWEEDS